MLKVRKKAKIRNRYNQASHLTNRKVTTSQLDITNESQEVSPFRAGDHKASINRRARKQRINDPQKRHRLGTVSKNILLKGLNRFHGAPTPPLVQLSDIKHFEKITASLGTICVTYLKYENGNCD